MIYPPPPPLKKLDRITGLCPACVWYPFRWMRALLLGAGVCTTLLIAAVAVAQDPLSLRVNADGSFELPPGADLVATDSRSVAVGAVALAGSGERGIGGDGGPASNALLSFPRGVAVDSAGNVYVADTFNRRVRRIDAETGIIETLAGTGSNGHGGDGGPASDALLSLPRDVAVDSAGNVYVADTLNHRVRRIDAETGIIETLAGTGERGYGGDGGAASDALLHQPHGVAVDSAGNVYVADTSNRRVRRIDAETGIIETLAGTGERGYGGDGGPASDALLSLPYGVAVDATGNVFLADALNQRVRRIDAATGVIETLAGTGGNGHGGDGGPASGAQLSFPRDVAVDSAGNVYVADTSNRRVRRVDAETGMIATLASTGELGYGGDGGPASDALLHQPYGVAVDSAGNVYVADGSDHRVRLLSPQVLVKFPLGSDGEFVILSVSRDGLLTLDGETVLEGTRITKNGQEYKLTAGPEGGVLATLVPSGPAPEELLLDRDWMAAADAAMVTALLDVDPAAVGIMDADARTPLHLAAESNSDPAVARVLLDRGASATAVDARGRTPLHEVVLGRESQAVAALLLERGAEPFLIDNDVKTALDLATANANGAVADLLADRASRLIVPNPHQVPTWRLLYGNWARSATVASVTAVLDADPGALSREVRSRDSLLHRVALMNPDPAVTRLLLERGADVGAETSLGISVIQRAASNRNPAVARLLLENGADATDLAALRAAARNRNPEVLELLLERGAEATDPVFLRDAALNRNPAVLRLLLERGADPNAPYAGTPPLHYAAQNPNAAVADLLLDRGADVNAVDRRGDTALHLATLNPNVAVARLLLDRGAEIEAPGRADQTPLGHGEFQTSVRTNPAVVQMLFDAGARRFYPFDTPQNQLWFDGSYPTNLSASLFRSGSLAQVEQWFEEVSKQGEDPLYIVNSLVWQSAPLTGSHWAAENPDPAVLEMLLDRGAKWAGPEDSESFELSAALAGPIRAVRYNPNPAVVELLLDRSEGVDLVGPYGWTLLHWAALNRNPSMAKMLLDRGADVNATTLVGSATALHEAARWNSNPAVAELLLDGGADLEAANDGGATPLHLSWTSSRSGVAATLLNRGAQHVTLEERLLDFTWTLRATPTQLEAQVINASDHSLFVAKSEDGCGTTALHQIGLATAANEIPRGVQLLVGDFVPRFDDRSRALRLFNDRAPGPSAIQELDAFGNTILHYIIAGAAQNSWNESGIPGRAVGLGGVSRFSWGWSDMRSQFQETVNQSGLQAAHYASFRGSGDFTIETPLTREIGEGSRWPYGDFTLDPLFGLPFPGNRIPQSRMSPCPYQGAGGNVFGGTLLDLRATWLAERLPETGGGSVSPPTPPPPPPPPSVEIEVTLGASGDKVTLVTTESGGWTLDGEAFQSGDTVTAEDGRIYVLTFDDAIGWTATLKP